MEQNRFLAWQGHYKKGIPELRAAFESAKSTDEKLLIFKKIEARLDENQLGKDCSRMAELYYIEDQEPLKVISFGKRALNIMLHDHTNAVLGCKRSSLLIAILLQMLGSASFDLKRYNECLSYYNWADRNLSTLLLDNFSDNSVLKVMDKVHLGLSEVKKVMGRGEEVVFHLIKVLEIKEKTMERDCIEIGKANKDVSDAYYEIDNSEQALSFSLKALEIYKEHLANDAKELAMLRIRLGDIYLSLGESDKALEQNRLSLVASESTGETSLLLKAKTNIGHILVSLGRHEEAVEALKFVISQPENAGNRLVRALAFMRLASSFYSQGKLANARKYIKSAVRTLETKGFNYPGTIATGFIEMAALYRRMKEYEAAISLVQKALNIPEIPQEMLGKQSLRLFSLISLSGTEKKRLPILEDVVERLKEKFGPEHCHVGSAYGKLGDVYVKLGILEMAAECFVRAKDILDVSLGPRHWDSLQASVSLSVTYTKMERYDLAIENQEKLVECLKGLVPSEQHRVDAAVKMLNILKDGATMEGAEDGEDLSTYVCQNAEDGEDLSTYVCQNAEAGEDLSTYVCQKLVLQDDGKVI